MTRAPKKILREYVRAVLQEGMKTIEDIPEGYALYTTDDHGDRFFEVRSKEDRDAYLVSITIRYNARCGAYQVDNSHAVTPGSGWGPFIYDVAMEWATEQGEGLMPDREDVSMMAGDVWKRYASRGDVESASVEEIGEMDNDMRDDCMPHEDDHLNRVYFKQPSIILKLKNTGLWWSE